MRATERTARRGAARHFPAARRDWLRAAGAAGVLHIVLALAWVVAGLGTPAGAARAEEGIAVTRAELVVRQGADPGTFVDAQFSLPLPPALRDAVDHGIALYFVIELEISRSRWYWFDQRLVNEAIQYRLSYSPLTRQYRLTRGGLAQPYDTLDQALATLRRVAQWRVGDAALLEGGRINSRIRLRLDTSMLPKPFQVSALTDRDWTLGSDWAPLELQREGGAP
jgi:hypothetical protein